MKRTFRFLAAGIVAAGFSAACGSELVAPTRDLSPRFSGGSATGGSATGGSATGGSASGGAAAGGRAVCTNSLSLSATASEALGGNTFSAVYTLNACQSRTRVSMTATDLATGNVVWRSLPDLAGLTAVWGLPYTLTSYRIDATASIISSGVPVATASTVVSTLTPLACTVFMNQSVTTGYWGIYPAVWAASDAQDCGLSGHVHLRITNLNTGRVEYEYLNLPKSVMIDFEGSIVSYDTPYRVYNELLDPSGNVLASSTTDVRSSVFR